ncbi:MAG: hypothetical protein J7K08_07080 [Thermoplasmata archaeon]|nr:hypothetical protein [Thermoplasmata archaeon]
MNPMFSQELQDFLNLISPRSKYVMVTNPFNVVPLSVALAKRFVVEENKGLLYICSGRPHIFPQKLFQRWEIPLKKIYFMDIVLYMKGSTRGEKNPPIKTDKGIIQIPRVYRLFRVDQEADGLNMSEVDLIIIDNLTEFLHFNTLEEAERFVDSISEPASDLMKGLIVILFKTEGHRQAAEALKKKGFVEVTVPPELFTPSSLGP